MVADGNGVAHCGAGTGTEASTNQTPKDGLGKRYIKLNTSHGKY